VVGNKTLVKKQKLITTLYKLTVKTFNPFKNRVKIKKTVERSTVFYFNIIT
jgi:hypothetical protein